MDKWTHCGMGFYQAAIKQFIWAKRYTVIEYLLRAGLTETA